MNRIETIDQIIKDRMREDRSQFHAYYEDYWAAQKAYLRLAGLAALVKTGPVVEIGTDSACGALVMAAACSPHVPVVSFDVREWCVDLGKSKAKRYDIGNAQFIQGDVSKVEEIVGAHPIELAYVDGAHDTESCLADLETLAPLMSGTIGLIAVDDYYQPIDEIGKNHTVTRGVEIFLSKNPEWTAVLLQTGFILIGRKERAP